MQYCIIRIELNIKKMGQAIKEKRTFFETFFLFCCHLKIKIILLYTTYRNMDWPGH